MVSLKLTRFPIHQQPHEVHVIGLEQVDGLRKRVLDLGLSLGLIRRGEESSSSPSLVFERAREVDGQNFSTREEFLRFVQDFFRKRVNPKLADYFPEEYLTDTVSNIKVSKFH